MAKKSDEIRVAVWFTKAEWREFRANCAEVGETASEIIRRLAGIWLEKRQNSKINGITKSGK